MEPRRAALVPVAAAAAVAVIGGSAFAISATGDGAGHPSPASSTSPSVSRTPSSPPSARTRPISNGSGDRARDVRLMRSLAETGYRQRPATGDETATVTRETALEAAEGTITESVHVVGLMWVGTGHYPVDDDGSSEPRFTWRLTWVIASEPHDAPPPLVRPPDAPPETGPPAQMQSVALVDAHSGKTWGWLGL